MTLPEAELEGITCKVVRTQITEDGKGLFGCEYIAPDPMVIEPITTFIRKRLRELSPEGFEVLRTKTSG